MTLINQGVKLRDMIFRYLTTALLSLGLIAPVLAEDKQPLSAEDAYRYVAFDTGDALELDWSIEDGYYLYKNKLGFASSSEAIVLGDPVLPAGETHEDEFFGEQQIYRERFFVSIPYTVSGERPGSIDLVLKLQGCAEDWFCHPPQLWTENVELRQAAAARPKLQLDNVAGPDSDFLPVDEAFQPMIEAIDGNTVEISWRIADGYYLYKEKISAKATSNNVQPGKLALPKGKLKYDEFFGEQEVYLDDVFAPLPLARATPDAMDLELDVSYQGCAEGGLCYPPTTRTLSVSLPQATTISDLSQVQNANEPVTEQARLAQIIQTSSIWAAAGVFFLAGLGLAFTPCVLPMVPILSGIIAGEGDDVSSMRGFTLALSYVMGMALVYTAAGIAAAAAGAQLQAMFNQPWVLILFAGLFVALALAMFGLFDLQMPSSIQSRLASASGKQKSGTMIGAFVMGALSSLVVTACVAPALIAALTVMAQSQDWVRGGVALFAMSLGMGAPLLAVGAAQGKLLPKAGPWMVAIKGAFGFMMLGLAIWMLSRILPGSITMTLWAALVFMSGVFMGGLTTLTPDSAVTQKLGKGLGLLAILYGIVLFLGAMTGGSNPLKPLASINFGGGEITVAKETHLEFQRIKTVDDLDRELARAASEGKTAMLDFYADWCVSCIEMEEYTFTDASVQEVLESSVLLQADVTANDERDQELLQRFGVFGPPTIIFFNNDGEQIHGYEVVGFMEAGEFVDHLNKTFTAGHQVSAKLD